MKHLRIVSNKLESVEEQISTALKTEEMEAKEENSPDQKTPQSSRYQKKTNEKQSRPKFDAFAEKAGIKKSEKTTMKTASKRQSCRIQMMEPKSLHLGAKSVGKERAYYGLEDRLRFSSLMKQKTYQSGAEILIKTQKEKGISGDSDVRCLRSRKTSEPKPRVTRGIKKDAKTLKDEDIVYTKKLRTTSHQKSETM